MKLLSNEASAGLILTLVAALLAQKDSESKGCLLYCMEPNNTLWDLQMHHED